MSVVFLFGAWFGVLVFAAVLALVGGKNDTTE